MHYSFHQLNAHTEKPDYVRLSAGRAGLGQWQWCLRFVSSALEE